MPFTQFRVLCLAALSQVALAHSWIEQLSNVAPNGAYISGYGYPRGFVDKGISHFDQASNVWLSPPLEQQPPFISQHNFLCHPAQRTAHQTPDYPRLQSVAGGMLAMRYAEGGHATIIGGGVGLSGKPEQGGTVFVFGTSRPSAEEALTDVLQWNRDGTGGDRRGRLLTAQNFDDGRCYQLRKESPLANARKAQVPNPVAGQPGSDNELLCETDVRLPIDAELGKPYTLYWVWQWPTAPHIDLAYPDKEDAGKDEYYTSCMDVDIVRSIPAEQTNRVLLQQDSVPSAVSDFAHRSALTTDPLALHSGSAFITPSPGRT